MQLIIKNGLVLQNNGTFLKGHIGIDRGKIAALWYTEAADHLPLLGAIVSPIDTVQIDAEGLLVSPGLIDTHVHGGNAFSFCYANEGAEWEKMEERLSSIGVTSVLATGSSLPPDETLNFIDRAAALAKKNDANQVEIVGIYMEGPYINKNKRGAHREECIRLASRDEAGVIIDRAGGLTCGLIKAWALAPEIEENMALIETLARSGISVSIAHTEAGYDTAMAAFAAGASRLTHTFNAMPSISHRYTGIISAAWQHGAFMELIADGHHVSPTIIRMFIAASDPGKIVLVSDNNELAGLPDGSYIQENRTLTVAEGQMKTESGSLAGSVASLNKCALNLTRLGYAPGAALKTVTENPARSIGVFDRKGSIALGKDADLALLDGQFEVMMTIKSGRIVYTKEGTA